ncbi:MAG: glycosyltransferase family 4 protein [Gemmatimonadaceae bacterium]
MKRLRILHLDSGKTWRGGQRQALLLALGLRDRGHEPFLIGSPHSPLVQKAQAAGLAVGAFPMVSDWDVRAARRIRSRMRAWNVDMVHAHDARSHALAMIAVLGRPEIPLVVTRRVAFRPRSLRIKYGPRVTRFIAISRAVRDAMTGAGIDHARISIVHSGIAPRTMPVTPRDWRSELGWPADCVVCGIVGAMTAEKGVDLLPAIAAAMTPSAAEKTRVVLLGGVTTAGVPSAGALTVHAAGFVADIDPAIAGLDLLWHPSRSEGLGTSVIDAMSLGVPPIAFAIGGLPEVIEDDVSGILVPARDPRAFARAASLMVEDAALRKRMSVAALARASTFTADAMTEQTEQVYEGILRG